MRRLSTIATILVLATSSFGCATGSADWNTRLSCIHGKSHDCPSQHKVKSERSQCGLRGLTQFHFTNLGRFEVPSPLRSTCGKLSAPRTTFHISSIGSPETDRGPPLS